MLRRVHLVSRARSRRIHNARSHDYARVKNRSPQKAVTQESLSVTGTFHGPLWPLSAADVIGRFASAPCRVHVELLTCISSSL